MRKIQQHLLQVSQQHKSKRKYGKLPAKAINSWYRER